MKSKSLKLRHNEHKKRHSTLKHDKTSIKYSYLIKTEFYDVNMINKLFSIRGNWEPFNPNKHKSPDFMYIDGINTGDKKLYNISVKLKSLVGDGKLEVANKNKLYKNLSKYPSARYFLPWTIELDIHKKTPEYLLSFKKYFHTKKPLICKISNMSQGQNIITTDRFAIWYKFMINKLKMVNMKHIQNKNQNKWILQKYIDNPLLKNDRKFHLRLMLLYQPVKSRSYYMPVARAALAEAPYIHGDWTNKDIHDTHFHKREGLLFPYDFPEIPKQQIKSIYKQIDIITKCVVDTVIPNCYPDSRHCFQFFGLDLMITNNYQVKLIEVNAISIGMSGSSEYKEMTFAGIMKLVVDVYFPPTNPQPDIPNEQFRPIA